MHHLEEVSAAVVDWGRHTWDGRQCRWVQPGLQGCTGNRRRPAQQERRQARPEGRASRPCPLLEGAPAAAITPRASQGSAGEQSGRACTTDLQPPSPPGPLGCSSGSKHCAAPLDAACGYNVAARSARARCPPLAWQLLVPIAQNVCRRAILAGAFQGTTRCCAASVGGSGRACGGAPSLLVAQQDLLWHWAVSPR